MYVSVIDYGADQTGVALSDGAFQAAASAANANGSNIVYVPPGTYNLSVQPGANITVWYMSTGAEFVGSGSLPGNIFQLGPRPGSDLRALRIGDFSTYMDTHSRPNGTIEGVISVVSGKGAGAAYFATQSADNPNAGSMGCIGTLSFVHNNNPQAVQAVYGSYIEVTRESGSGTTQGMEIDIVNRGDLVKSYPYAIGPTGMTNALWLASGGEHAVTDSSLAIGIINNGASFEKGLVFSGDSLDKSSGEGVAVALANGHSINWFNQSNTITGRIRSDATNSSVSLVFSDGAVNFQDVAGNNTLSITTNGALVSTDSVKLAGPKTSIETRIIDFKSVSVASSARPGVASSLPAAPAGYMRVQIAGDNVMIPFYRA